MPREGPCNSPCSALCVTSDVSTDAFLQSPFSPSSLLLQSRLSTRCVLDLWGVTPRLASQARGTVGYPQMNWDGEGFETLPDQRLMKPQSRWQGTVTGEPLSLCFPSVKQQLPGKFGFTLPDASQLPGAGPFPRVGPGHSPKDVLGTQQRGHTWFGEDKWAASSCLNTPAALRAGKSTSSLPSPARVQRMYMQPQSLL